MVTYRKDKEWITQYYHGEKLRWKIQAGRSKPGDTAGRISVSGKNKENLYGELAYPDIV